MEELVACLRQNRDELKKEWTTRISEARLWVGWSPQGILAEATNMYDTYVEALETDSFDSLQRYARELSARLIARGLDTDEVVRVLLLLRNVLARSLFNEYSGDLSKLNRMLDAYESAASRIAIITRAQCSDHLNVPRRTAFSFQRSAISSGH